MKKSLFFFFAIVFFACSEGDYERYDSADLSGGWRYEQSVSHQITIPAGQSAQLEIDHSADYAYENIYLQINTPNRDAQTLSIPLADDQGYWIGSCSGDRCQRVYPLEITDSDQPINISIQQYSRDSILMGIHKVNLLVGDFSKK